MAFSYAVGSASGACLRNCTGCNRNKTPSNVRSPGKKTGIDSVGFTEEEGFRNYREAWTMFFRAHAFFVVERWRNVASLMPRPAVQVN